VTATTDSNAEAADALDGGYSSLREKMLEHAFLTELARALWRTGRRDFEFLRAEVDRGGYDVVVECEGILRHIQLKSRHRGGKASEVSLALALARKPSGCAVWMDYDPVTLEIGPFLWFGGAPGEPLPDLGGKVTRHSKGGQERPGHRLLRRSAFTRLANMDELARALFGAAEEGSRWHRPAGSAGGARAGVSCPCRRERPGGNRSRRWFSANPIRRAPVSFTACRACVTTSSWSALRRKSAPAG
jgi:hypothetical protein